MGDCGFGPCTATEEAGMILKTTITSYEGRRGLGHCRLFMILWRIVFKTNFGRSCLFEYIYFVQAEEPYTKIRTTGSLVLNKSVTSQFLYIILGYDRSLEMVALIIQTMV